MFMKMARALEVCGIAQLRRLRLNANGLNAAAVEALHAALTHCLCPLTLSCTENETASICGSFVSLFFALANARQLELASMIDSKLGWARSRWYRRQTYLVKVQFSAFLPFPPTCTLSEENRLNICWRTRLSISDSFC